MKTDPVWTAAQRHEVEFWGNCLNLKTWHEFVKQEMYSREMQLLTDYSTPFDGEFDMRGKSVLDIGGGPVSMTLRCYNASHLTVVDPIAWPKSALRRYEQYGIDFYQCAGEDLSTVDVYPADEVWVYNVLQHVSDPNQVLAEAKKHLNKRGRLRIFEWINIPADKCHPHVLTPELLSNGLTGLRIEKLRIPRLTGYWTPPSGAEAFVGVFSL